MECEILLSLHICLAIVVSALMVLWMLLLHISEHLACCIVQLARRLLIFASIGSASLQITALDFRVSWCSTLLVEAQVQVCILSHLPVTGLHYHLTLWKACFGFGGC
jgi:hypothetical protein